jgi:hypothetical protein
VQASSSCLQTPAIRSHIVYCDLSMPQPPSVSAANLRTGAILVGGVAAVYFYTMYHLKATAPGTLENMVR